MTINIGIWQPRTHTEIQKVVHTAGLYGAGVLEVWDEDQLQAVVARTRSSLIVLEQDTHAIPLGRLMHPENPFYLIGPQNGSIPREVRDLGRVVQVETPSRYPLQPSVVAAIVLHDNYITGKAALV